MKILTKEEEAAHYNAVLRGGLTGGTVGLGTGLGVAYLLNRHTAFFRGLTLPLKAFFVSSSATFCLIIAADRASRGFEMSRRTENHYQDESARLRAIELSKMSSSERFLDWGREHRYSIVGSSWVASMAGSLALVYRDPYLTRAQKLVQARVYAQGLTVLVLIATAAFEISAARMEQQRAKVMIPDPTDPTGKRMIEKKPHHEHYKGEDLWMDMVKQEEQRLEKRKKEAEAETVD